MMVYARFATVFFLALFSFACTKKDSAAVAPLFDSVPLAHNLTPLISEISGIADSKINKGYLWAHEDSGTPNQLHLILHDGTVVKQVYLKGIVNRDWEDMALVGDELLIAETGDNAETFSSYAFYRFSEPPLAVDTVTAIDTIQYIYPDGSHDAEAFLADPVTKDIFILTKRDNPSRVYKLAAPYTAPLTATLVGTLPYSGVVGAALSTDGKEILIRTYGSIYHYRRTAGQRIDQALVGSYSSLAHQPEPQGEAVCFANDGAGYFTLSEKAFASMVQLRLYKRR